jgi:hypothetical protein
MPQIRNAQLAFGTAGDVATATTLTPEPGEYVKLVVTYEVSFSAESAAPGPYRRKVSLTGYATPLTFSEALTSFAPEWTPYRLVASYPRKHFGSGVLAPATVGCVVAIEPTMASVSPKMATNQLVLPGASVRVPPAARFAEFIRGSLDAIGRFFIRVSSRERYDSMFRFEPDAAHIGALPQPLSRYIRQLQDEAAATASATAAPAEQAPPYVNT